MPDLTADRLELLDRFRAMYVGKQFEASAFDLDGGYLQTTLADDARMPLRFFVEYNNAWWFAVISGVEVPMTSYDPVSDSGAIVLDIDYEGETLRAMQHVHFGDGVINRIRTYASGAFFDRPDPAGLTRPPRQHLLARDRVRPGDLTGRGAGLPPHAARPALRRGPGNRAGGGPDRGEPRGPRHSTGPTGNLTCGIAMEPPIGIEPMTYSLRVNRSGRLS